MREHQLDYYMIPGTDPHFNEYLTAHFRRRDWISGFTGSQGDLLVGLDAAYLWTDSRYFVQAAQELDPNLFQLMKQLPGLPSSPEAWLVDAQPSFSLGVDPQLITQQRYQAMSAKFSAAQTIVAIEDNWVDAVRGDVEEASSAANIIHMQNTGESVAHKLQRLRQAMVTAATDGMLISGLADIAWLLNVRDVAAAYNPVVTSYLWVEATRLVWFVEADGMQPADRVLLIEMGVEIQSYASLKAFLSRCAGRVWLDPAETSWWVTRLLSLSLIHI